MKKCWYCWRCLIVLFRTDPDSGRFNYPDSGRFDDPDSGCFGDPDSKLIFFSNRYRTVLSKNCRDPGSNRGPLNLQSNALPTELSRLVLQDFAVFILFKSPWKRLLEILFYGFRQKLADPEHWFSLFFFRLFSTRLGMTLKVHKNENFFGFDFEICTFS